LRNHNTLHGVRSARVNVYRLTWIMSQHLRIGYTGV